MHTYTHICILTCYRLYLYVYVNVIVANSKSRSFIAIFTTDKSKSLSSNCVHFRNATLLFSIFFNVNVLSFRCWTCFFFCEDFSYIRDVLALENARSNQSKLKSRFGGSGLKVYITTNEKYGKKWAKYRPLDLFCFSLN